MTTITTYTSNNAPELTSSIYMNKAKTVIMSLPIGDLEVGDILFVCGEMQATNDTDAWALFSRSIILANSATANTGTAITEDNGENFNPVPNWYTVGRCDVHHLVASKSQIYTSTKKMANAYVNFIAWSATDPSKPSYKLTVDKGYGKMSVAKIRG